MIIEEIPAKFPFTRPVGRTLDRLHLTDIISDLEREVFPVTSDKQRLKNRHFAEVGFLFEDILSQAFRDKLGKRIGEIEYQGIIGTPDGIDFEGWLLEEYKCTWRSSKTQPHNMWRWLVQIKGYLKMLQFEMTQCKMRILYLNGNYKGSGPEYKEYMLSFIQEEIDNNWDMLQAHAKRKGWL